MKGSYLSYSLISLKALTSVVLMFGCLNISSQNKTFEVRSKALDAGVYDYKKVQKNSYKALYGKEAFEAVIERILADKDLRSYFFDLPDDISSVSPEVLKKIVDEDIVEAYYPELDIAIHYNPVSVSAYDLTKKKNLCGDPKTYAVSPSGKYRFSSLYFDGNYEYYLEEEINGEYKWKGEVQFNHDYRETIYGLYWADDETIHYLREVEKEDGSKYQIGYAGIFTPSIN